MKRKNKPKGSVIAALDIGSTKIACFIARIIDDEGNYKVLGVGHQAALGVSGGRIADLAAAEASVRHAVHAAENMAAEDLKGYPLRDVVVNVSGNLAKSYGCGVEVQISGQEITDNDVRRALAKAQDEVFHEELELIHTIPTGYRIDGNEGIKEPRGMFGEEMEVATHLVASDIKSLKNMALCVERSHLDIEALCLSSYAAGLACLVEDEMDLGTTVIDMGGGITSIAIFHNGNMIYSDSVPVGGQHVTNDIAKGLNTSIASAERLKNLYGNAMGTSTDSSEMIDVPQLGDDHRGEVNHIPRSLLIGIIQPRVEEILELAREKLDESDLGTLTGRRVVLTGGGSQLQGLRDLAQIVLNKQVRLGVPIRTNGLPDAVSGPAFATTAGLLTYVSERSDEMPAEILSQVEPTTVWERVKYWVRENW